MKGAALERDRGREAPGTRQRTDAAGHLGGLGVVATEAAPAAEAPLESAQGAVLAEEEGGWCRAPTSRRSAWIRLRCPLARCRAARCSDGARRRRGAGWRSCGPARSVRCCVRPARSRRAPPPHRRSCSHGTATRSSRRSAATIRAAWKSLPWRAFHSYGESSSADSDETRGRDETCGTLNACSRLRPRCCASEPPCAPAELHLTLIPSTEQGRQ